MSKLSETTTGATATDDNEKEDKEDNTNIIIDKDDFISDSPIYVPQPKFSSLEVSEDDEINNMKSLHWQIIQC